MTPTDVKVIVAARGHKDVSTAGTDDDTHVNYWLRQAIRYVQQVNDWPCHKTIFSITLTADDYDYDLTTLLTRFRKIDGSSVRSNKRFYAWVDEIEEIDAQLGPAWKDSASGGGTPQFASLMGQQLILAQKPDAAFVASNPTVDGYYFMGEDVTSASWLTTELKLYEDFFDDIIEMALIYGLQQEDDSEFRSQMSYWVNHRLPGLRGYDPTVLSNEVISGPDLWVEGSSERAY